MTDITMADVKLAFAKEAAREAAKDTATISSNMHPTEFIAQGIQLEDQQYVIPSERNMN